MKIMINNWQKSARLPLGELKKTISIILKRQGEKKAVVGITFVDDKTIHDLNKRYRKKDKPTDVLSFYFEKEERAPMQSEPLQRNLIGDVVISTETAIRQAKENKHSLKKEITVLLIHGILHLLGYDHIKQKDFVTMNNKEKDILQHLTSYDKKA